MENRKCNVDLETYAGDYLEGLKQILSELDLSSVSKFVQVVFEARENGSHIFFIGNGGSAATASHFANDFTSASRSCKKLFRAVSLTDNAAILTSLANDHGYDKMFVWQLKDQMIQGDVVVAISASGNSQNIVQAIEYANANGGITVALTGFDGGQLRQIARHNVHVPTMDGNYGHTEDIHLILDHLIAAYMSKVCAAESKNGGK